MRGKPHVKLKANIKVENIQEYGQHIAKAQYLLEELNKEMEIISDFKLRIENKQNGCP